MGETAARRQGRRPPRPPRRPLPRRRPQTREPHRPPGPEPRLRRRRRRRRPRRTCAARSIRSSGSSRGRSTGTTPRRSGAVRRAPGLRPRDDAGHDLRLAEGGGRRLPHHERQRAHDPPHDHLEPRRPATRGAHAVPRKAVGRGVRDAQRIDAALRAARRRRDDRRRRGLDPHRRERGDHPDPADHRRRAAAAPRRPPGRACVRVQPVLELHLDHRPSHRSAPPQREQGGRDSDGVHVLRSRVRAGAGQQPRSPVPVRREPLASQRPQVRGVRRARRFEQPDQRRSTGQREPVAGEQADHRDPRRRRQPLALEPVRSTERALRREQQGG